VEVLGIKKPGLLINKDIIAEQIRLISSTGQMMGIVPTKEALAMAESEGIDLVMMAPATESSTYPVCKLMDYKKRIYQSNKKQRETNKRQKKVLQLKEIRLSVSTERHDFDVKVRQAISFLQKGHKVKVSIRFKGREMHHTSLGQEVLQKFASLIEEFANVEKPPLLEGKSMMLILAPKQRL